MNTHAYPAPRGKDTSKKQPRNFGDSRDFNEDRSRRQIKLAHNPKTTFSNVGTTAQSTAASDRKARSKCFATPALAQAAQPLLITQKASPSSPQVVHFFLFRPGAKCVCLAGSFNDWKPDEIRLIRDSLGNWMTELRLQPGDYEYRFIVDAGWEDDPLAKRYVPNPFGSLNSVLDVGAPKTAPTIM